MQQRSRLFMFSLTGMSILCLNLIFAQYTRLDSILSDGSVVHMKINPRTGVPQRLTGLDVDFKRYGPISESKVEAMSRAFLAEYADLLHIDTESLSLEKAESRKGRWYVNFVQKVKGVPVYHSGVGFTIFPNGAVPVIGAEYYPDVEISTAPNLTADKIIEIAQASFGDLGSMDSVVVRKEPELTILPIETPEDYAYFLVYHIELESEGSQKPLSEAYFIDANNGDIVKQYSNIMDGSLSGYISYRYWPKHYYDATETVTYANSSVELINYLGRVAATQNTQSNGGYYFGNLAIQPFYVYPRFRNSYVRVWNESPSTSPLLYPTTTYSWTVDAIDGSNVFWHANRIHNYFKGAPFYYNGMDYQTQAYVKQGSGTNGAANGHNIFFGSQGGQHWARSSDVVYHEYTHNTIYHLYGHNWIGTDYYEQDCAMNEGLPDYFACTLNNHDIQGESVGVNRDLSNNYVWTSSNGAHWNGQVIGGACWDLRGYIGVSLTDELAFDALEMTPHAYDFEDFALNVLVADDNDGNLNNGTPHYDEIEQAFEINHGIPVYDPPLDPPPAAPTGLTITNLGQIGQYIQLAWNANSEPDLNHYNVWRRCDYFSPNIDCDLQVIATTTSTSYTDYEVLIQDNEPDMGIFYYYVTAVDDANQESGTSNTVVTWGKSWLDKAVQVAEEPLPEVYALHANHPNPFNPVTTIRYALPEASSVSLVIYDIAGREVRIWNLQEQAGYRQLVWNGTDAQGRTVPTGIYIYRLVAASVESDQRFTASRKMVMMR